MSKKNKEEQKTTTNPKLQEVSAKIQEILESSNFALQPFLSYSEFGLVPRVRLVEIPEENNETSNDKGTDTNEAGVSEGQDGTTEA